MGSKVIPVRLDEELARFIEELVELGVYGSRSEALRDLIRAGVERIGQAKPIIRTVDRLFELERMDGDIPVRLEGALKQLLDERERL